MEDHDPSEKTHSKQKSPLPPQIWRPGQSGNPAGRPLGAKNKLGEAFVAALHEDFNVHGVSVIEKVRLEKPDQYLKVIASIIPKELIVREASLEDLSDDELIGYLTAVRSSLAAHIGTKGEQRTKTKAGEVESRGQPN